MTTRELTQLGDTLGDVSAALTFVAERTNKRHRERLAQLRTQALLIDQEATTVQQLPRAAQPTLDPYDDEIASKPAYPMGFRN